MAPHDNDSCNMIITTHIPIPTHIRTHTHTFYYLKTHTVNLWLTWLLWTWIHSSCTKTSIQPDCCHLKAKWSSYGWVTINRARMWFWPLIFDLSPWIYQASLILCSITLSVNLLTNKNIGNRIMYNLHNFHIIYI